MPPRRTGNRLGGLAALLLLAAPALARANDVEFYAVVDRPDIEVGDTLTLTVTVSAGDADISDLALPDAPDFDVISRSQSQQMSFSMGGANSPPSYKRVVLYTILLAPKKVGTFTIKPGKLKVGGKSYATGEITVKVVPNGTLRGQPQQPPQQPPTNPFGLPPGIDTDDDPLSEFFGGGAQPTGDADLYLRATLDKKQAFAGEQVTLGIYLFSRVDITGVESLKMPKLDGFWSEDLETPTQISGELKMIDGVPYRVFLLRKRALFPLKPGKMTIDPVEVDVATGYGFVLSGRRVHRASQPLTLEVNPLPPGAPPGFDPSNVGQFKLSLDAAPTTLELGNTVQAKITLEGRGNLKAVTVPKLPALRGFRMYDPTPGEKLGAAKGKFGGTRTLDYLLMPEQTGEFELPALSFVYFDPATQKYETSSTPAVPIKVEAGAGGAKALGPGNVPAPADNRAVNLLGSNGIRPLHYKGTLERARPVLYQRPWYVPVALSPLALLAGLGLFGLARSTLAGDEAANRKRRAGSRARRRLKRSEELLAAGNVDGFYAESARALNDYLGDKLGAPVVGLTRADLKALLVNAGAPVALADRLCAVLDTCDAGRFAPGGSEKTTMTRLHDEALEAMDALEDVKLRTAEVRA